MNINIGIKTAVKRGIAIGMAATSIFLGTTSISTLAAATESKELVIDEWKNINDSTYTSTQGMCMDNKNNVYVAKINNKNLQVQIYKITSKGTKSKVIHKNNELGHANDMTYCSANGYIYVATGGDNNLNPSYDVIAFDPSRKDSDGSYAIVGKYKVPQLSKAPSGIAYDSKYNVFYIKKGKEVYVGNFKKGKFESYCNKTLNYGSHDKYINQGITAYNGKIYVPLWNGSGKNVIRTYKVTKKSNTSYLFEKESIKTYDDNSVKEDIYEIEAVDFSKSGQMYFVTNGKNNDFIVKVSYLVLSVLSEKANLENFESLEHLRNM